MSKIDWTDPKSLLKIWWSATMLLLMTAGLFDGSLSKNLAVMSHINLTIFGQNLLVITSIILVFLGLRKLHPFFNWSWWRLFKPKGSDEYENGKNINFIPTDIKWVGLLFCILLILNLPALALQEENWFRLGTITWTQGLYRSLLFGMMHCLVGIPLAAGIALTIGGLWFTHQYFIGGVDLSSLHHTTYNLILGAILLIFLILMHIVPILEKRYGRQEQDVEA
ncbi:MAG: hypothetical protein PHF35_04895 [Candidatus Moranbacteria bacterium]|nr:hypothetical protein [Candidatus Moranbacteria bacterium]